MRCTLLAEFDSIIYTGTESDCEKIKAAMVAYGIREDKFRIVSDPGHNWMSIPQREAVHARLELDYRSSMFGDGLEYDYIRDGVCIVGLNEMTDDELLEALAVHSYDVDEDELLKELHFDKHVYEELLPTKKEPV